MSQYMLMFSLGPVQSFIAQARKTRDLWLGSFLLSTLMEAAMKGMKDVLVFPTDPTIKGNIPDLPNKYVAVFDTIDDAEKAAKHSEDRIKECWQGICDDVWKKIILEHAKQSVVQTRKIWDRQVNPDAFFETFWVIVEGNPDSYQAWLKLTQKTFDARKRLRDFKPQLQGEPGEKSTISGERESLHGNKADRQSVKAFWKELASNLSTNDINQDGEERLDAIDTVKRFAYYSKKLEEKHLSAEFPSTSSIATATFVEKLLEEWANLTKLKGWLEETEEQLAQMPTDAIPYLSELTKKYPEMLDILKRDGDCYFRETFTAYRLKKDYGFPYTSDTEKHSTEERAKAGQEALTALLRETERLEPPIMRPTPYYAMVQMDGDKMGELLNGVPNIQEHKAISDALSKFSRTTTPDLVKDKYPARLIYAGGDDVFALAPLARDAHVNDEPVTVLDLVDRLQRLYRSTVEPAVSDNKRKESVTASTGIAIAHHYTSLSYVRRVSKEAEKLAKEHYGRNALAVTIIRRSGEQTQVGCHWRYKELGADEDPGQPIALFSRFYQLFKDDVVSPKCIYTLLEEAPALVKMKIEEAQDSKKPSSAMQSEIKRVLKRQRDSRRVADFPDTEIDQYAWYLTRLAAAIDADEYPHLREKESKSVELHSDKRRYGLVEVLGWLLVMAFLARKGQE